MLTAAKHRNPVRAFSRDGLRISTGSEPPPGDESLTAISGQQTVNG
jgi:hypothetical protein